MFLSCRPKLSSLTHVQLLWGTCSVVRWFDGSLIRWSVSSITWWMHWRANKFCINDVSKSFYSSKNLNYCTVQSVCQFGSLKIARCNQKLSHDNVSHINRDVLFHFLCISTDDRNNNVTLWSGNEAIRLLVTSSQPRLGLALAHNFQYLRQEIAPCIENENLKIVETSILYLN